MNRLLVIEPLPIVGVVATRGTGAANLLTADPKEVWADDAVGSPAKITIDLGIVRTIDTIFLGHVRSPAAAATWAIATSGAGDAIPLPTSPLRVPDVTGSFAPMSHALWYGPAVTARVIELTVQQPAGAAPVSAGSLVVGRAFVADLGQEWGAGRQTIDTGTATSLPSGGFAVVEGVRKRRFSWTFGDLSQDEADQLELIAMALGETRPGLVIENVDRTAGLIARIRYGKFGSWRPFERRNRQQTRWEISIEDWA